MATTIEGIGFELTFDGSKMMASINAACDKVRSHFTNSFSEAGNAASKAVENSNQAIRDILNDTEKSMKSKASSIAAIYRKEGDSMSDAMRKAWSHIERNSAEEAEEVKGHFISIRRKAKDSADKMSGSFSAGFSKMKRDAASTNKSISGSFSGMAKKVAAALASAFAVKKIIDFGKECINLGSDLAEVQNVVDVTFPNMTAKVNEFAKAAITTAGLSETMAKKYTGTFGAMAKAFGFSESAAYEMSTTLTQLAGDVASFYNLSQDEAYTKLKSVFSGETETLKDLGVVMTQSALDAYALANGYGKTTAAMTEMEKVALRYQFVQSQLSAAQGDFARTSDSWANQTRIMALQLQSIMATIGQGLINLFTPAVKMINTFLGKVAQLAEAFKGFTELITGKKSESGSGITDSLTSGLTDATAAAGDTSSGLTDAAGSAGNLADNTGAVGEAAKKAAKEMKALMGFDVIEKLPEITDSDTGSGGGSGGSPSSGGSGGSGLGALGSGAVDFGKLAEGENVVDDLSDSFEKLLEFIKPTTNAIKNLYNDGFRKLEDFTWGTIKDFWENFLKPMGTWMIRDDAGLPRFFNITNDLLNEIDWDRLKTSLSDFYTSLQGPAKFSWTGLMDFYENFLKPVSDWTMSSAIPTLVDEVTNFNNKVDWPNLNDALAKFWSALSHLTTGIGQGAIDFIDNFNISEGLAGAVNLFADALSLFADAVKAIPADVLEPIGSGLAAIGAELIIYKGASALGGNIRNAASGLSALLSAVTKHPVLTIIGAGAAITAFMANLYNSAHKTGFESDIEGIADSIGKIGETLSGSTISVESDYTYIDGILDKYMELNNKLLKEGSLSTSDQSMFEFYHEELVKYAPDIEEKIGGIGEAYKGTKDELQKLIDKQHEQMQFEAYKEALSGYMESYADASVKIEEVNQKVRDAIKGVEEQSGKTFSSEAVQNMLDLLHGSDMDDLTLADDFYELQAALVQTNLPFKEYADNVSELQGLQTDAQSGMDAVERCIRSLGATFEEEAETPTIFSTKTESGLESVKKAIQNDTPLVSRLMKDFWKTFPDAADEELQISGRGSGVAASKAGIFHSSVTSILSGKKLDLKNIAGDYAGMLSSGVEEKLGISGGVSSVMQDEGKAAISGLTAGTDNESPNLLGAYGELPGQMIAMLGDLKALGQLSGLLIPIGLRLGLNDAWPETERKLAEIPGKVQSALSGMYQVGQNAAVSFVRGLQSVHIPTPHFSVGTMAANAAGVGFSLPKVNVAWLAQGGFVEKNTPQLAMIGDNRHQGEVVAPEDKLLEMAKMAASMGGNPELLQKIISLLETLISLVQGGDDIVLSVDGEELARAVMTGSLRLKRRYTTVEVTI